MKEIHADFHENKPNIDHYKKSNLTKIQSDREWIERADRKGRKSMEEIEENCSFNLAQNTKMVNNVKNSTANPNNNMLPINTSQSNNNNSNSKITPFQRKFQNMINNNSTNSNNKNNSNTSVPHLGKYNIINNDLQVFGNKKDYYTKSTTLTNVIVNTSQGSTLLGNSVGNKIYTTHNSNANNNLIAKNYYQPAQIGNDYHGGRNSRAIDYKKIGKTSANYYSSKMLKIDESNWNTKCMNSLNPIKKNYDKKEISPGQNDIIDKGSYSNFSKGKLKLNLTTNKEQGLINSTINSSSNNNIKQPNSSIMTSSNFNMSGYNQNNVDYGGSGIGTGKINRCHDNSRLIMENTDWTQVSIADHNYTRSNPDLKYSSTATKLAPCNNLEKNWIDNEKIALGLSNDYTPQNIESTKYGFQIDSKLRSPERFNLHNQSNSISSRNSQMDFYKRSTKDFTNSNNSGVAPYNMNLYGTNTCLNNNGSNSNITAIIKGSITGKNGYQNKLKSNEKIDREKKYKEKNLQVIRNIEDIKKMNVSNNIHVNPKLSKSKTLTIGDQEKIDLKQSYSSYNSVGNNRNTRNLGNEAKEVRENINSGHKRNSLQGVYCNNEIKELSEIEQLEDNSSVDNSDTENINHDKKQRDLSTKKTSEKFIKQVMNFPQEMVVLKKNKSSYDNSDRLSDPNVVHSLPGIGKKGVSLSKLQINSLCKNQNIDDDENENDKESEMCEKKNFSNRNTNDQSPITNYNNNDINSNNNRKSDLDVKPKKDFMKVRKIKKQNMQNPKAKEFINLIDQSSSSIDSINDGAQLSFAKAKEIDNSCSQILFGVLENSMDLIKTGNGGGVDGYSGTPFRDFSPIKKQKKFYLNSQKISSLF